MGFLLRVLAEQWLDAHKKTAYVTCEDSFGNTEGRWYPDTPGNRQFFNIEQFPEEVMGLLPPEIYCALPFQKPECWKRDSHYPWFRPYPAAREAAIVAVAWCIYKGVYRHDA